MLKKAAKDDPLNTKEDYCKKLQYKRSKVSLVVQLEAMNGVETHRLRLR